MSSDAENGIKGIIANGINLKLESAEEENYYVLQMCDFFNNETTFKAYITGVHSFEIEFDRTSPVMEVIIKDSLLFIVPYTEDVFEAFAEMLGFIAKNHEKIILDLRGKEHSSIHSPDEVAKQTIDDQRDDDDDDDYEWI